MKELLRLLTGEWLKLQKWLLWILLLPGPFLAVWAGSQSLEMNPSGADQWLWMYSMTVQQYGWMFYPVLTGVFAALICRYEHVGGGWKHLLVQPVSRTQVYLAKAFLLAGFAAASQVMLLIFYRMGIWWNDLQDTVSWGVLLKSAFAGWVAVLPLAALQLWVSFLWRSFGVPLAINIALSLPTILAVQSKELGPFYPWAQPMLAMMPTGNGYLDVHTETLVMVVGIGFLVAGIGGWLHFIRRDQST